MATPWTCSSCNKTFMSESGFSAHRTGGYVDIHPCYGRRCLSDSEFSEKGYCQKLEDLRWRKVTEEGAFDELKR